VLKYAEGETMRLSHVSAAGMLLIAVYEGVHGAPSPHIHIDCPSFAGVDARMTGAAFDCGMHVAMKG
jgi:hypothetical protein